MTPALSSLQAMAPPMQRSVELSPLSSPKIDSLDDKAVGTSSSVKGELGDGRQGNISVEIWKKALLKVYGRVCPVRAAGHDCGCLQSLITLVCGFDVCTAVFEFFNPSILPVSMSRSQHIHCPRSTRIGFLAVKWSAPFLLNPALLSDVDQGPLSFNR